VPRDDDKSLHWFKGAAAVGHVGAAEAAASAEARLGVEAQLAATSGPK